MQLDDLSDVVCELAEENELVTDNFELPAWLDDENDVWQEAVEVKIKEWLEVNQQVAPDRLQGNVTGWLKEWVQLGVQKESASFLIYKYQKSGDVPDWEHCVKTDKPEEVIVKMLKAVSKKLDKQYKKFSKYCLEAAYEACDKLAEEESDEEF